ncbi:hypothetical protein [Natrinema versiforme]|uniref:hypothetical protein n=1 Tax=Natrinema versiforme TaxID=88724 RepID=UPI000A9A2FCC|nr:hypothetical protein [Natrinema versiforme]
MDTVEADDTLESAAGDYPGIPLEQSEPDCYLPGTPTVSFLEYVDIAVRTLFR